MRCVRLIVITLFNWEGLRVFFFSISLDRPQVVHFQRKLATVEQEVSQVEKDTSQSLSYLVKLDTVKTKLKATSKALQEADNWTTLMADIEDVRALNSLSIPQNF